MSSILYVLVTANQEVPHMSMTADCLGSIGLSRLLCKVKCKCRIGLLCSIQALLSAPNPDDPLAENVAKHWKENEAEAVREGLYSLS